MPVLIIIALAIFLALRTVTGASGAAPRLALGTDVHAVARALARDQALTEVSGEPSIQTAHFIIKYPAGDEADAEIVASQAEKAYSFVFGQMGGTPSDPVLVRVETRSQLASDLSMSPSQDPLGAYWRGAVWLLTPSAYLPGSPAQEQAAFNAVGPLVHELTHLADDDLTGGRTPPFLDEGMAQYMQWRFSGYLWLESDNSFCQPLYSWSDLANNFDNLQNQALAYHESFAVVQAVAATGKGATLQMLHALSDGATAQAAVAAAVGPGAAARLDGGSAWSCRAAGRPTPGSGPAATNALNSSPMAARASPVQHGFTS